MIKMICSRSHADIYHCWLFILLFKSKTTKLQCVYTLDPLSLTVLFSFAFQMQPTGPTHQLTVRTPC